MDIYFILTIVAFVVGGVYMYFASKWTHEQDERTIAKMKAKYGEKWREHVYYEIV